MALLFTTQTHTHTHKKVQYSTLVFPFSTHGCGWEGCWGASFQQSGHYFTMAVCLWPIRGHGDWNVTQHFLEGTRQKGHKGCHCMQDTVWKHMADKYLDWQTPAQVGTKKRLVGHMLVRICVQSVTTKARTDSDLVRILFKYILGVGGRTPTHLTPAWLPENKVTVCLCASERMWQHDKQEEGWRGR